MQFKIALISLILFSTTTITHSDVENVIDAQKELKTSAANKTKRQTTKSTDAINLGRMEFETTCAICHGDDAKGNGPFASQLTRKPKDLTIIKNNNGGIFPAIAIYNIIDGRMELKSHGSRTMPAWGRRFAADSWLKANPAYAETIARGKILELILYLDSIQE